jgi:multidrug efflux pump subunit AcrB
MWRSYGDFMNRLLILAILALSTVPVYAQSQQPNAAKLKADAQKVVSIISRDKAMSQIYCQVTDLGEQIDNEKDSKKAEALVVKMNDLEKQLGAEYLALLEASKDVDPNSKDGQDVMSMFDDELDESCPD